MGNILNINKDLFDMNRSFNRLEIIKILSNSGVNHCTDCNSDNVITNLIFEGVDLGLESYKFTVIHICNDCRKSYKVSIKLNEQDVIGWKIGFDINKEFLKKVFEFVFSNAKNQIELYVRQRMNKSEVVEH